MDYYKVLGTHKQATAEEINNAYQKRMQEYNPEKLIMQGEEKYNDSMKRVMHINEAYNALIDPEQRKKLDQNPKLANKKFKETEKKSEKLFHTTIRKKIEDLKHTKIKTIRERAESVFIEDKSLLRQALEDKSFPVERMRDKIERRKKGPLTEKKDLETTQEYESTFKEEPFKCPLKPDECNDNAEEGLTTEQKSIDLDEEYTTEDNEAIAELTAPMQTGQESEDNVPAVKIVGPEHEMQLGKRDEELEFEQDFFNTQAMFYKALMLMEQHKFKQAMDIFLKLMPYSETYPYLYVIHACQCAFHLGNYNFILDNTLDAMRAYLSPKYMTFLIDKPDNHIFKLLLELFFQNFALCSTKKKIRLKKLIQAENEVFHLVKNLSKRNRSLTGYAGFQSAVAYADLSEIYKEKAFILKALEKLNYVPRELYEKKTVKRINKIMKKFFTRKEVKSFSMLYPVLRVNS